MIQTPRLKSGDNNYFNIENEYQNSDIADRTNLSGRFSRQNSSRTSSAPDEQINISDYINIVTFDQNWGDELNWKFNDEHLNDKQVNPQMLEKYKIFNTCEINFKMDQESIIRLANFYPLENYFYVLIRKCTKLPQQYHVNSDGIQQVMDIIPQLFISTIKIYKYLDADIKFIKEILIESNNNPCIDYGPSQIFYNNSIYYFKRCFTDSGSYQQMYKYNLLQDSEQIIKKYQFEEYGLKETKLQFFEQPFEVYQSEEDFLKNQFIARQRHMNDITNKYKTQYFQIYSLQNSDDPIFYSGEHEVGYLQKLLCINKNNNKYFFQIYTTTMKLQFTLDITKIQSIIKQTDITELIKHSANPIDYHRDMLGDLQSTMVFEYTEREVEVHFFLVPGERKKGIFPEILEPQLDNLSEYQEIQDEIRKVIGMDIDHHGQALNQYCLLSKQNYFYEQSSFVFYVGCVPRKIYSFVLKNQGNVNSRQRSYESNDEKCILIYEQSGKFIKLLILKEGNQFRDMQDVLNEIHLLNHNKLNLIRSSLYSQVDRNSISQQQQLIQRGRAKTIIKQSNVDYKPGEQEIVDVVAELENIKINLDDANEKYYLSYNPEPIRWGQMHPTKNQIFICDMYGLNMINLDTNEKKFILAIDALYPTQFLHIGPITQNLYLYSQHMQQIVQLDSKDDYRQEVYKMPGNVFSIREINANKILIAVKKINSQVHENEDEIGYLCLDFIIKLKQQIDQIGREIIIEIYERVKLLLYHENDSIYINLADECIFGRIFARDISVYTDYKDIHNELLQRLAEYYDNDIIYISYQHMEQYEQLYQLYPQARFLEYSNDYITYLSYSYLQELQLKKNSEASFQSTRSLCQIFYRKTIHRINIAKQIQKLFQSMQSKFKEFDGKWFCSYGNSQYLSLTIGFQNNQDLINFENDQQIIEIKSQLLDYLEIEDAFIVSEQQNISNQLINKDKYQYIEPQVICEFLQTENKDHDEINEILYTFDPDKVILLEEQIKINIRDKNKFMNDLDIAIDYKNKFIYLQSQDNETSNDKIMKINFYFQIIHQVNVDESINGMKLGCNNEKLLVILDHNQMAIYETLDLVLLTKFNLFSECIDYCISPDSNMLVTLRKHWKWTLYIKIQDSQNYRILESIKTKQSFNYPYQVMFTHDGQKLVVITTNINHMPTILHVFNVEPEMFTQCFDQIEFVISSKLVQNQLLIFFKDNQYKKSYVGVFEFCNYKKKGGYVIKYPRPEQLQHIKKERDLQDILKYKKKELNQKQIDGNHTRIKTTVLISIVDTTQFISQPDDNTLNIWNKDFTKNGCNINLQYSETQGCLWYSISATKVLLAKVTEINQSQSETKITLFDIQQPDFQNNLKKSFDYQKERKIKSIKLTLNKYFKSFKTDKTIYIFENYMDSESKNIIRKLTFELEESSYEFSNFKGIMNHFICSNDDKYLIVIDNKSECYLGSLNENQCSNNQSSFYKKLKLYKKFRVSNIKKCGFCFDNTLIWFKTEEVQEEEKIYYHSFKLFCIKDLKMIYNRRMDEKYNLYHIKDVIFDPNDNTQLFFITNTRIFQSKLLQQHTQKYLKLLEFKDLASKQATYNDYVRLLGKFIALPIKQNLIHLFTQMNNSEFLQLGLKDKIQYHTDSKGRSPVCTAIHNDCYNAIEGLLDCMDQQDNNSMTLTAQDTLNLMIYTSPLAKKGLDTIFSKTIFMQEKQVPNLGRLIDTLWFPQFMSDYYLWKKSSPIFFFNKNKDYLDFKLIKNLTLQENPKKSQIHRIEYLTLQFPYNFEPGSQSSIELLQNICDSTNISIFRSKILLLIKFKWNQVKYLVQLFQSFYICYAAIFIIELQNPDQPNLELNYAILIMNILLFFLEFHQIVYTGFHLYIADFQNTTDIIGIFTSLIYSALHFEYKQDPDYQLMKERFHLIAAIFVLLRGTISSLYIINTPSRMIIKFIIECVNDARFYVYTFWLLMLSNATIHIQMVRIGMQKREIGEAQIEETETEHKCGLNFICMLVNTFFMVSGDIDTRHTGISQFIMILGLILFNIIFLNLLIAVMGDTFDRVQDNRELFEYRIKCQLMLEVENLLSWKRNSGHETYLHLCRYVFQTDMNEIDDTEEWGGTVQELKNKLKKIQIANNQDELKIEVKNQIYEAHKENYQLQAEVNNLQTDVQKVNKNLNFILQKMKL